MPVGKVASLTWSVIVPVSVKRALVAVVVLVAEVSFAASVRGMAAAANSGSQQVKNCIVAAKGDVKSDHIGRSISALKAIN